MCSNFVLWYVDKNKIWKLYNIFQEDHVSQSSSDFHFVAVMLLFYVCYYIIKLFHYNIEVARISNFSKLVSF